VQLCNAECMKLFTCYIFSIALFAQSQTPVKFGAMLQQGSTSLYCGAIDLRPFGGIFAQQQPAIECLMKSSDPAVTSFDVSIVTAAKDGTTHTYQASTPVSPINGRSSPILFPTDDTILLSVTVLEKGVLSRNVFDGNSSGPQ